MVEASGSNPDRSIKLQVYIPTLSCLIHGRYTQLQAEIGKPERIKEGKLSKNNKKALMEFCDNCLAVENITIPCTVKYLYSLIKIGEWLNKDFIKANKKDIISVVQNIQEENCSDHTKHAHKVALKKFFKWLRNTNEYPYEVRWIKSSMKRNNYKLPEELLTEEEIIKMIENADNLRDKALISTLFESGCRVGEILTLKNKNLVFDKYGCTILVDGKTGMRRVRLVSSTPYLANWKENHSLKDDKDAPLWVGIGNVGRNEQLNYPALRKMLIVVARKSGIKKKINPHNFRHSSATIKANFLTEAQMKEFFGWVQSSDMAQIYVHLSGRDTDRAILQQYGIVSEENKKESALKPKVCARCSTMNAPTSRFCNKCGAIIDIQTAITMEEKIEKLDEKFAKLLQDKKVQRILIERMNEIGLV